MEELIKDLKDKNMIYERLYFSFMKGGPPAAGGLIGALIENSKTYFCSLTKESLYLFKIKNFTTYKGVKFETMLKINISDIQEIEWRPKTFTGFFKITYKYEKISGTISRGKENKNNFEKCLSFLEEYPNILFRVR